MRTQRGHSPPGARQLHAIPSKKEKISKHIKHTSNIHALAATEQGRNTPIECNSSDDLSFEELNVDLAENRHCIPENTHEVPERQNRPPGPQPPTSPEKQARHDELTSMAAVTEGDGARLPQVQPFPYTATRASDRSASGSSATALATNASGLPRRDDHHGDRSGDDGGRDRERPPKGRAETADDEDARMLRLIGKALSRNGAKT